MTFSLYSPDTMATQMITKLRSASGRSKMIDQSYADTINTEEQLEEILSRPDDIIIELFSRLKGDLIFLGVGGKIGPSLARMAKRACERAGVRKRIIGVSLFESREHQKKIEKSGIETLNGDLLNVDFIRNLPVLENVIFLAGMKFGSSEKLSLTWAVNSYLPAIVAELL